MRRTFHGSRGTFQRPSLGFRRWMAFRWVTSGNSKPEKDLNSPLRIIVSGLVSRPEPHWCTKSCVPAQFQGVVLYPQSAEFGPSVTQTTQTQTNASWPISRTTLFFPKIPFYSRQETHVYLIPGGFQSEWARWIKHRPRTAGE